MSSLVSNITIYDQSLGGNYWLQCYSQDANVGYVMASAAGSQFVRCGSEDADSFIALNDEQFVDGGALGGRSGNIAPPLFTPDGLGGTNSASSLAFGRRGTDGNIYIASMPAAPYVPGCIGLGKETDADNSVSYLCYNYTESIYPYQIGSWIWKMLKNGVIATDLFGVRSGGRITKMQTARRSRSSRRPP